MTTTNENSVRRGGRARSSLEVDDSRSGPLVCSVRSRNRADQLIAARVPPLGGAVPPHESAQTDRKRTAISANGPL